MPKKGGLSKKLKSFFRSGSSSRSAAPVAAQSQYSIPTTAFSASNATQPLETGEAGSFVSSKSLNAYFSAPWAEWQVENDLLQKLDEWNRCNPEHTVMRVLKRVHDKLEILESQSFQNALDLIPDSPFPAGHLVKCLLNLLLVALVCFHSGSSVCCRRN